MAQGPCTGAWNNIGEHFIGVKLTYPNETIYGWIRVEGTGTGTSFTLTIKDYACNINHYSEINNVTEQNKSFVFPSPFNDKLAVNNHCTDETEIIIYDLRLRIVMQQKFTSSILLNTESLFEGMYFYQIKEENQVISNGKILKL